MQQHLVRSRALRGVLALMVAAVAGGCSSSSKKATTTTIATASTTTAAAGTTTSAAVAASTTTVAADSGAVDATKLLAAADVGSSFTAATWSRSTNSLPCTPKAKAPDVTVVPAHEIGAVLQSAKPQLALTEVVRSYASATDLTKASDLVTAGFRCPTATLGLGGAPTTFTIKGPTDVKSTVGGDSAQAWELTSSTVNIIVVAAVQGDRLVGIQFSGVPNADTTGIPNPLVLTKRALDKLSA